jgi:tetratricopeptide (TPR) repeat protein
MSESATLPATAPAPPITPSVPRPSRWGARVDVLLVALVLAFAFFAGSFVARNSDAWLHLATGRLIAGGDYRFGTDPFAFTTAGQYWANHAWLFDLGLYLAFHSLGGVGLVVLKAIAVAATAGAMLLAARGRGPVWLVVGCVLLGVLAMSPRVLLQPAVVSFLLLAVTLCCLRAGGKSLRAVPIVIAFWVNLDAWFILGPALVLLFWIGRRIDPERSTHPPWPRWLVPASLLAWLLNPHHIYALMLPLELSPAVWASGFPTDPRFAGVFVSPWHIGPLGAAGGYNLAAWAFFVLLFLGLVSFGVNRRALRSSRSLVWVAFAMLAMWQARLIPFFAVVAAPIAAMNLGEVLPGVAFRRTGRAAVLLAGTALAVLAWIGSVNGFHNRDRGVAWALHTDPTLERTARGITAWRQTNAVPSESHVWATHPDVGHYLAWFAPGERCFLDSRLQLFTPVAADYAVLSRMAGVLPGDGAGSSDVLRAHNISASVLYDPDFGRMTRGLHESSNWEIARVDGAAVLLVPKGSPYSAMRFDPERSAFGGGGDLGVAANGPATMAEPRADWDIQRERGRKGSWEADAATVFLRLFEESGQKSPALPLLAIRASRVGIEADSTDPTAWLMLGRAYLLRGELTWEQEAGAGLTLLDHVRLVQIATALRQAVLLSPDSVPAHESLAGVFLRRNALDLGHIHTGEALRLVRRAGPRAGETAEAFAERIARASEQAKQLESAVQDAENRFIVHTVSLTGDPLARARIAAELGLVQKAIDILLKAHPDLYGTEGLGLLADLLLQTGQASECRILLDRIEKRNPDALGTYNLPGKPHPGGHRWNYRLHAYDWLDFCQCAAVGRYIGAAAALDRMLARYDAEERSVAPQLSQALLRQFRGEVVLWVPPTPLLAPLFSLKYRVALTESLLHTRLLTVARADLATLGGVLELERGDPAAAARRFESALALFNAMRAIAPSLPGEPLAMRYHEAIRKQR